MIPGILAGMTGIVLFILFTAFRSLGEQKKDIDTTNWHISSLKNELAQKEKETEEAVAGKDRLQKELESLKNTFTEQERAYQEIKSRCTQWEKEAQHKQELVVQLEQQKKQLIEQAGKCKSLEKDLQDKYEEIAVLEQKQRKSEQDIAALNKELNEAREESAAEKQKAEHYKKELAEEAGQEKSLMQQQILPQEITPPKGKEETAPREKTDSLFSRFLKPKINAEELPAPGEASKAE